MELESYHSKIIYLMKVTGTMKKKRGYAPLNMLQYKEIKINFSHTERHSARTHMAAVIAKCWVAERQYRSLLSSPLYSSVCYTHALDFSISLFSSSGWVKNIIGSLGGKSYSWSAACASWSSSSSLFQKFERRSILRPSARRWLPLAASSYMPGCLLLSAPARTCKAGDNGLINIIWSARRSLQLLFLAPARGRGW